MSEYILTSNDIQKFIDSKRDNEPIGITCDNSSCLVAEAFQWKYPRTEFWSVGDKSITIWEDERGFVEVPFSPDVKVTIDLFDQLSGGGQSVTKRQWQEFRDQHFVSITPPDVHLDGEKLSEALLPHIRRFTEGGDS